jgi:Ca2+-binding RTX toxin-like protein
LRGSTVQRFSSFHLGTECAGFSPIAKPTVHCFEGSKPMAVTRVLRDGESGDVKLYELNYDGAGIDRISVLNQPGRQEYTIFTYAGNDIINLGSAGSDNQHAIISGAGRDTVTGSAGSETAYDGQNNDIYSLGAGVDIIYAGTGNDTYNGGIGIFDTLRFDFSPSNLQPVSGVTPQNSHAIKIDLTLKTRQDFGVFGKDIVLNIENVVGGDGADRLSGTSGSNQISGGGGSDTISGRAGADLLNPGGGTDTVLGGSGIDTINLQEFVAARDKVKFTAASDSLVTRTSGSDFTKYDRVNFFDSGTETTADRIDLSGFVGTFRYTEGTTFSTSSAKEVRIDSTRNIGGFNSRDTVIYIDTDSDRSAEMRIYVMDVQLQAYDFIL